MNRVLLACLSFAFVFCISACSGSSTPRSGSGSTGAGGGGGSGNGGGGGTGGGGGGSTANATLSLTLRATPPSPTANLSILAFRATVTSILMTPSSGSVVNVGTIDDVYGVVSDVSTSTQSFTLQTAYRGAVSMATSSSTTYDPNCPMQSFACVSSGAIAAVDGILNDDGTLTVRNYSPVPFTAATKDTIEGVVYTTPSSVNQVLDLVITDASFALSGSLLSGSVHPGDLVVVGVVMPQPFFIVSEGLTIPANSFSGSTDVGTIQPGQTVALSVSGFVPADGSSTFFDTATANGIALRFTRVAGTVANASTPQFSMTNLPPYFGFITKPSVQITTTGPGTTTDFDGTPSFTEAVGDTISISALYFGSSAGPAPPAWSFSAATIRKQ